MRGASVIRGVSRLRLAARHRALFACAILFITWNPIAVLPVLADGCFVFRWDKKTDINEPTQKAIIVHDGGREDLLLQVKYEGPPEDFGWLIPVPSLPKVEKGSMRPFYELSKLTQEFMGGYGGGVLTLGRGGSEQEGVKEIDVKTVGAYEVAVLSAQDAGSLERWLRAHHYSIPEGKGGVIDEYVRKGWYFVAAKIELDKGGAFKLVSSTSPRKPGMPATARKVLQRQLSSGELHPLLISFDTAQCVFPLRISAVGGKPSEVSLYVLSAEPLLDPFIFGKALAKLHQRQIEWDRNHNQQTAAAITCAENALTLSVVNQMLSLMLPRQPNEPWATDWPPAELLAMGKEGQPFWPPKPLDDRFDAQPHELIDCLRVTAKAHSGVAVSEPWPIPECAKQIPRLKNRSWFLTKHVWTFQPEEMHDLEFQPAIPALARFLPLPEGSVAACALSSLGVGAVPTLVSASRSTDVVERINATLVSGWPPDPSWAAPVRALLGDKVPQVRLHAIQGAERIWDPQFVPLLFALLRDPHPEIRREAATALSFHEPPARAPAYVELLKDRDPDVQAAALQVLSRTNLGAIPRPELLRLLSSPRISTVSLALNCLEGSPAWGFFAPPTTAFPRAAPRELTNHVSSAEAAPLTTNQLTLARLMGLKILRSNADADAVELTLPLLRDTNSFVRSRAFSLLRAVSGQDLAQSDPAKWEQWWAANRDHFNARKPTQP